MSAFDVEYAYRRGYEDGHDKAQGLSLQMFCRCAEALRKYWNWENSIYQMGIDLTDSAPAGLADSMIMALGNGNIDWAYDTTAEMNWIVVWCSELETVSIFEREVNGEITHIYLPDAGALYDFVNEMRELGWPEWIENQRWLE